MTESHAKSMAEAGIKSANFAWVPNEKSFIINCLSRDPADNTDTALKEIYKRMRQGDPSPSTDTATACSTVPTARSSRSIPNMRN